MIFLNNIDGFTVTDNVVTGGMQNARRDGKGHTRGDSESASADVQEVCGFQLRWSDAYWHRVGS
jgi:hypothetical protein